MDRQMRRHEMIATLIADVICTTGRPAWRECLPARLSNGRSGGERRPTGPYVGRPRTDRQKDVDDIFDDDDASERAFHCITLDEMQRMAVSTKLWLLSKAHSASRDVLVSFFCLSVFCLFPRLDIWENYMLMPTIDSKYFSELHYSRLV